MVNKVVDSVKTKNKKQRSAPHAPRSQEAPRRQDHQYEQPCDQPPLQSPHPHQESTSASLATPHTGQGDCSETSSKQRNTRGPTVGLGTCSVVNKSQTRIPVRMNPEQKLVATVEIQNMFVNEIGLITRANAPLNVSGWKKVTLEQKMDMATSLRFKFDVDLEDPDIWEFIDDHMSKSYGEWKGKLHKHFKEYAHDLQLARATPPTNKVFVTHRKIEEWHWLVDNLYTDEKYKKRCKVNADNRKKKEYEHTGGSRPFLKHKEAAEKKGQHVTLIDNWNNMHMHRDKGVWVNEAAENKGKKMKAAMAMYIQQESASSSNPPEHISVSDMHQLGIMTKELGIGSGKRIRGLGSNLRVETSSCSTSRYGKNSVTEDDRFNKLSETVEKLCDIVKQLQAGINDRSRKKRKRNSKCNGKGPRLQPDSSSSSSDSDDSTSDHGDNLHGGGGDVYTGLENIGHGH